jgi:zinc transport system substrate-binding protein
MKKIGFITIVFALFMMFVACGADSEKKAPANKKISIVAAIYPQYDWLKNVLGERADSVDLKLLIKNGTDLHSYKPSAQDIASIAGADLVVYVGGESDGWIEKALEATPKEGRIALNLMNALGDRVKEEEIVEGMQVEEEHHHEHGEEHAEEAENDEHIWLSLKNAWILVNALAQSLSKVDTANSSIYTANAVIYNAKLWALDSEFTTAISGASQKTVLFGDRFPFRYLVDDYGIKYYAAFVGCSAESEASFETVTFLAGKMDSLQLPAIFTIDGSNGKIAHAILEASKKSKETPVLVLNSMQSVTDEQIKAGADYLSMMRDNLEVLKKAIK